MKIAFNPSTVAALTTPPNNKDITFDLRGHSIFARGVEFKGTDTNTWRDIKINNVSIGSHTLDLRNGSNTTLTNTNGVVTINSTWRPVVDNLTSDSTTSSLSAKQGKVLKALIDGKSNSDHTHDDRYYTKAESNAKYITDITTSVNKLTFTRNGSNIIRDITVNVVHSQGYLTNIPNKDNTTKASSGLYIYNSYNQVIGTNSYSSVLSINTGGTIQIAGNWGDDQTRNLYWRSQSDRNVADYPWKSWRTILDSENYSSTLDSRYYTESEVNSLLDAKLNRQNLSYGTWNPRGYHLAADYHYNGGDLSISENNGKMYISVDGCFWQNEGQYRVLDTSDIGDIRDSVTLHQYLLATDAAWYPLVWGGAFHNNTSGSTGPIYKSYDKLCWQTSSQTLYATNIQTNNIKNLSIGGGIYWNPNVEWPTDKTDAASITLVSSGVAGGTTLVLSQMNDPNDTIQFKTNTAARLYHNNYPILTTQNTYVSNNKGYINGTEITQVNNADTLDGYPANGSNDRPYGHIPTIESDGVMEVGRYIDFHNDNNGKHDFSTRLQSTGNYGNEVNLPSASGTLALINDVNNYYWANVKISTSSSTTTSPTVSNLTATGQLYLPTKGNYNAILMGDGCWMGDCNISNVIGLSGTNNANSGGIKFGKGGMYIGYNGSSHYSSGTSLWTNFNADTVDGEHASNFSYTHQSSFDFSKSKSGRIVTFDQSNTDYEWINGFASTHRNYLTSVIFNTHRTSNWYVGYMEGNRSTGETKGLQAVHKLAFADGDENYPIFLGYLNLYNGNDGTISGSFPCLGYSVPFTYTRGGSYCLINIPNTSFQTFYIKAAIAAVHYSGAGMGHLVGNHRGDGAWWLHCDAVGSNAVQVKGFHLANKNNDSWWGGNPLYSSDGAAKIITVCLFGYVKFR